MRLHIELNGKATNPYARFNLTQNPFPQIADHEYADRCVRLQSLGGEPIPHDTYREYIRQRLEGFSEELISACIDRFTPGELVVFTVTWEKETK